MLTNAVYVVALMDPIRYLLPQPVISGKIAKWIAMLSEFGLKYNPQKLINERVVLDFLADFSIDDRREETYDMPD